MASWKKIIVSGSSAELSALKLTGLSDATETKALMINSSDVISARTLGSNAFTTTTIGTTTNSLTDGNGIADFTFNGSAGATVSLDLNGSTLNLGSSGVKVADAGITATQIATSVAGDGLSGGAGTALAVEVAQTTITSVVNSGLEIGRDADNRIKFGTDNNIIFEVGGADGVIFKASGEISASLLTVSDIDEVDSINAGSSTNGNLDFTSQGTVNLRASNSTTHGLQLFGGVNGAANPHIGTVTHEALDFNVGTTQDVLVLAGAAGNGMLAGEARFIGHVSASSVSASGNIHATKFFGDGSGLTNLTSANDVTINIAAGDGLQDGGSFTTNQGSGDTITLNIDVSDFAGDGLGTSGEDLIVNVDDTTIETNSDTLRIKDDGVTYAKIQNVTATNRILGRDSAGAGVIEEISPADVKTMLSLNNVPNSDHTAAGYSTVTQLNASSSALQTNIDTKQATLTFGKSSGNALKSEEALATNDVLLMGTNNVKGRTYTQFLGDLGIEAGATADQSLSDILTLLGGDLGGNFTFGDQADDIVRFTGGVTVEGDLVVNGNLTTVSSNNLLVKDKFTTFASGSTTATDGGILVQNAANAGYGLGFDTTTTRWVLDADLALDATDIVADAYMGTIQVSTAAATGNPTYGGSTKGHGTIHVDTNTGDIFIYA